MAVKKSRNSSNRLEQWFDFTQKLYSTLELDQGIRTAMDVALQLTGMQRGMLLTYDTGNGYRFRHAQNRDGRTIKQEEFPSSESMIKEVREQRVPLHRVAAQEQIKTALCIPLLSDHWSDSPVIAILYCDSPEAKSFGDSDKETIKVFLEHAGPALETLILYDMATRDPLTEVYQRHYFDAVAQTEWRRTLRHKHPLAILKIDLDQLREVNDEYGRQEGNFVLQKTAEILKEVCRTEDLIARYDIDEFALLLPETETAGARHVANRICEEVPLLLTRNPEKPVSVSVGGAAFPRCAVNSIHDLMKLADIALYQAKQAGGKRAIVYEPSLSSAHKKVF
jgi:diguanylate cyclase (GGDEF)-like protein